MKYQIPENVLFRDEGEEGIVFEKESTALRVLNNTGNVIWQGIQEGLEDHEILAALVKHFPETPKENIETDFHQFIEALKTNHFLEQA